MSKIHVVIGANYGDEGKGLITDYLVNREKASIVVRFNGGAQAGHTVVTPDGLRHVFHHFASGTFDGAKTYLGRHFVANPMIFFKEEAELLSQGIKIPQMLVDPRVMVSTPYDMIVNQIREEHFKFGSCGVGVTDTIDRNKNPKFTLTAREVSLGSDLNDKLQLIRNEWVELRLKQLGISYDTKIQDRVMDDNLFNKFLEDLMKFGKRIQLVDVKSLNKFDNLIFEGGQGLGLDKVQGTVPNVTQSFTGLDNVIEMCKEADIKDVDVYYVTRAYLTRHGVGSMENELKQKPYDAIDEVTNVTNEFQGAFRYGNLDVTALQTRIRTDLSKTAGSSINFYPKLAVTCIDHLDDVSRYVVDGKIKHVSKEDFSINLAKELDIPFVLESQGPTRATIREIST